jgi:hypothetical protein
MSAALPLARRSQGRRRRVADVIRSCWDTYNRGKRLPPHVVKAVRHILSCRTATLGGHIHECDQCGSEVPMYNSCQDRHCPTCQTSAKEKWLAKRREELLPVQYFHTVFTVSHDLNGLIEANRTLLLATRSSRSSIMPTPHPVDQTQPGKPPINTP